MQLPKKNCWLGSIVSYDEMESKGQESYNSAKLISIMAEYGYLECAKISDDKWGADMLFYRPNDADVKKVQLKGRATFCKHYLEKDIYIAYPDTNGWYLYPHDETVEIAKQNTTWSQTLSWMSDSGGYSWHTTPMWLQKILSPWQISQKTDED